MSMKIRVARLSSVILIPLLSFLAVPPKMQDNFLYRLSGSANSRGKAGKTSRASAAGAASGYTYSVLYSFCSAANCTDGNLPAAALVQDATGNLYGTTVAGGANSNPACGSNGCGTAFKLDNTGHETVLYSFCSAPNCADGAVPQAALIQDAAGNLFGTTAVGGANVYSNCTNGCGTVFKLDNTGRETVLYSFCSNTMNGSPCLDGSAPQAGLIEDASGNFYGTTKFGGPGNGGTVFELDNTGHETVLDAFCEIASNCPDGSAPEAGLIRDAAGNVYGTTSSGGIGFYTVGGGTVFELGSTDHGTLLYSFCLANSCPDGSNPEGGLLEDAAGNLYGTTASGGAGVAAQCCGAGTAFKVDAAGHHTILYSFCTVANCADGEFPAAGLTQDAAGNLYSTTTAGGANSNEACGSNGCGTVFKLDDTGHETVAYNFCSASHCTDGAHSQAGLIQDSAGNLYGTAAIGGANGSGGVLFKLTPPVFVINGTPTNVSRGATTASTITVTPGTTFTGSVVLTAAVTSSPAGAQDPPMLSFGETSPVSITGVSGGTATLTIITTAPTSAGLAYPTRPTVQLFTVGGTALAVVMLVGIPARHRSRQTKLSILILLPVFIGGFVRCGGEARRGSGTPGTTPGAYTIAVRGTSGSTTAVGTVALTVQ
jgi:uncharacterized repeat protein (TIGR03803 family)